MADAADRRVATWNDSLKPRWGAQKQMCIHETKKYAVDLAARIDSKDYQGLKIIEEKDGKPFFVMIYCPNCIRQVAFVRYRDGEVCFATLDFRKPIPEPRYKCHKEVVAWKIIGIEQATLPLFNEAVCRGSKALGSACGRCQRCKYYESPDYVLSFGEGESRRVSGAWFEKHKPLAGGYFVLYEDLYESYSPAAEFESGYTRI